MKVIRILCAAVAAALLLQGCEKTFLDKQSRSALPGEWVVTTEEGLDILLTGAYNGLQNRYYYGGILYLYEATKGPDFFQRNASGGYSFYSENGYSGGKSQSGNCPNVWTQIYNVIRNTTILLESIDDVTGDIGHLRHIKGEAYAIRALCYFDLLRLYAYPPKFSCPWGSDYDERFKWGVPIIDTMDKGYNVLEYSTYLDADAGEIIVYREDRKEDLTEAQQALLRNYPERIQPGIGRNSAEECWRLVESQLEKAWNLMKDVTAENGRIGAAAILALRQRVALYMEDYAAVISLGEEWLSRFESIYAMISYDSYPTQYYKPFSTESIFELKFTESDNNGSNSINYWARKQTYNIPGSELDGKMSENIGYAKLGLTFGTSTSGYELLETYPLDVRRYLICDLGVAGTGWKSIRRYVGEPYHYVHNIPLIRLPEIYFNMSEAFYKRGRINEAIDYLSRVTLPRRQEAAPAISSVNTILDERRREFIFEGQTYFDWFRNGRSISGRPVIGYISSSATINFGGASNTTQVVYPIPLLELNANPALRRQQNPGYGEWEFGIGDDETGI